MRWSYIPAAVTAFGQRIRLWCDSPERDLNQYLLYHSSVLHLFNFPPTPFSPLHSFTSRLPLSPLSISPLFNFPLLPLFFSPTFHSPSLPLFLGPVKGQTVTGILITPLSSAQTGSHSLYRHTHTHTHTLLLSIHRPFLRTWPTYFSFVLAAQRSVFTTASDVQTPSFCQPWRSVITYFNATTWCSFCLCLCFCVYSSLNNTTVVSDIRRRESWNHDVTSRHKWQPVTVTDIYTTMAWCSLKADKNWNVK